MENENLKPKKIFETTREKDSLHTGEQCSTLVIKEVQLKPTVRHHFTPTNTVNLEQPATPGWRTCGMPRTLRRCPQELKAHSCSGAQAGGPAAPVTQHCNENTCT